MANVLKVVFLGLISFSLLVYFTIPNKSITKDDLSVENLPQNFEFIGKNIYFDKEEYFKNNRIKYIVVLNHDSLFVFKNFYKKYKKNDILFVANIYDNPWLLKQFTITNELEKMYKESKISIINDSNGKFIEALQLSNNKKNSYFIYKITRNNKLDKIYEGQIAFDSMKKEITNKEIEIIENNLYNYLK